MAGSRVEKVGTIFTRLTGLLRSGALREEDKPIWYDVYKAFPPKQEPRYGRPVLQKDITNILYREDVIRAKFYKQFPNMSIDMTAEQPNSLSERFIRKYSELESQQSDLNPNQLFQATAASLNLMPSASPQEPAPRPPPPSKEDLPGPKFKLEDVFVPKKE